MENDNDCAKELLTLTETNFGQLNRDKQIQKSTKGNGNLYNNKIVNNYKEISKIDQIMVLDGDPLLTPHVINSSDSPDEDKFTKCGVFGCSPKWLQIFASKKSYIVIYGLLGLFETCLGSYFIGTISTIEKRFKFPSAVSGILTSAWDVGTLIASLIIAYFANKGNKAKLVASGILIASISCFMRYLPHLIYGPGDDALYNSSINSSNPIESICNASSIHVVEDCTLNTEGSISFVILIISLFLLGAGTAPYYTLGAAYLDDNVLKNKFPFLFSIAVCVRFLGPTLGFLLSSYTLSIFIETKSQPSFGQDDPRWIGAWYLGWNPLGFVGLIIAFLMAHFPKILPREAARRRAAPNKENKLKGSSFKDFKETLLRLSKNPVYMFNTFSSTVGMLGLIGFWIFMPKYIETQFRKTASEANLITGTIGLISTAVGVVSSGVLISKYKPRAKYLAAWNVFTETLDFFIYTSFAYLGCYKADLHGHYNSDQSWNLTETCNAACSCSDSMRYSPVCSMDKSVTFYSACHAGCSSWTTSSNGTKIYENCTCIDGGFGQAMEGSCPIKCEQDFIIFLILLCLMEFLSSTGRSGNTIIQYRAVDPADKSFSIALTAAVLCALAFIPGPVIHGMLLDQSCTVWGMTCGKTGNCWLYDGRKMRFLLNFTAAGLMLVSVFLDIGVYLNVTNLKIYDDNASIENKPKFPEGANLDSDGVEDGENPVKITFLDRIKRLNLFMINNS